MAFLSYIDSVHACSDTNMNIEEFGNVMPLRGLPGGLSIPRNNSHREDEGDISLEPYVGLEFDSAEGAQEFYNIYATRNGFRIRIGQLYRSITVLCFCFPISL